MLAENIYNIAIHLSDSEIERLYMMLGQRIKPISKKKVLRKQLLTDRQAIDYLLINVFKKSVKVDLA